MGEYYGELRERLVRELLATQGRLNEAEARLAAARELCQGTIRNVERGYFTNQLAEFAAEVLIEMGEGHVLDAATRGEDGDDDRLETLRTLARFRHRQAVVQKERATKAEAENARLRADRELLNDTIARLVVTNTTGQEK